MTGLVKSKEFMEIIDKYGLEKDILLNAWIVFEKVSKNAWHQVYKSKNKKEAKGWVLVKVKKEGKKKCLFQKRNTMK